MKKEVYIEKAKKGYLIKVGEYTKLFKKWDEVIAYITGYFGLLPKTIEKE